MRRLLEITVIIIMSAHVRMSYPENAIILQKSLNIISFLKLNYQLKMILSKINDILFCCETQIRITNKRK